MESSQPQGDPHSARETGRNTSKDLKSRCLLHLVPRIEEKKKKKPDKGVRVLGPRCTRHSKHLPGTNSSKSNRWEAHGQSHFTDQEPEARRGHSARALQSKSPIDHIPDAQLCSLPPNTRAPRRQHQPPGGPG